MMLCSKTFGFYLNARTWTISEHICQVNHMFEFLFFFAVNHVVFLCFHLHLPNIRMVATSLSCSFMAPWPEAGGQTIKHITQATCVISKQIISPWLYIFQSCIISNKEISSQIFSP